MKFENQVDSRQDNIENMIMLVNNKIERLKTQFNLYFAGELRVPPEGEREELEKMVREILFTATKSPRGKLLMSNLTSRFSLYNNMWKKKLNEIETGLSPLQRKKAAYMEEPKPEKKPKKAPKETLDISLNREDSFDNFYEKYNRLMKKKPGSEAQKEKIINSLKAKLISKNLIDARVDLAVEKGKLKLKIKK
ncbi:MAG: hypothetical protein GY950_34620 [bacterium]|nr:hypothetical protein [bacterium]